MEVRSKNNTEKLLFRFNGKLTGIVPFRGQNAARRILQLAFLTVMAVYQISAQNEGSRWLETFLGDQFFITSQLWEGRGGTSIVVAQDGTVLAFHGRNDMVRVSDDGGITWHDEKSMQGDVRNGNAIIDEITGDILFLNPGEKGLGKIMRSRDNGKSWVSEEIAISPDGFGLYAHSVGSMQPGITLMSGRYKGRLIMPARIYGPQNSNDVEWRSYHYSTALFSDDRGKTWRTSKPFPVLGTGEAALAELSDGSILYNSREHMSPGNRYLARSYDGGETWIGPYRSAELPDGPIGSSYGCMGGMIRLPVDGYDILVYSNLDTGAGEMPESVGGSITREREKITLWVSFDGGESWPVKRLVFDGPAGYSNLAAGRTGTASEGKIYMLYEGGPDGRNSAVQVAVCNLGWILDGKDISSFIKDTNLINKDE
ncbi:MAG: glycoside hydrolase [Bacteroidales bacterium]|jgi:sialidase-1|nr:glycoside hydrolase [Bacteroidales bacterium]